MKDELKQGRIVVLRNGEICIIDDTGSTVSIKRGRMYSNIKNYNDVGTNKYSSKYDIMAIYENPFEDFLSAKAGILYADWVGLKGELVWQRPAEIPEYTMQEAIEKMGHEFKIKK